MRAKQIELGIRAMIEAPDRPPVGVVTLPAFGPQRPAVDILCGMTRPTRGVFATESLVSVTGFTRRDGMEPKKRKSSQIMIE